MAPLCRGHPQTEVVLAPGEEYVMDETGIALTAGGEKDRNAGS